MENQFSFKKGWQQLPSFQQKSLQKEVMEGLQISISAFYARMRGETEPKVSEAKAIEAAFRAYGLKEVWGN